MIENIEIMEEEIVENGRSAFVETAHKVLLASIGAVVISQEEISSFVGRLVERGEIAEKDGRKMLSDVVERRREATNKLTDRASNELDRRIESVLERLNVPTKKDFDKLTSKINGLSRKIDQLKKAQEA
ncbi:MAG: phasin family protein [Anaerolineales bacterium]|nr:phasin family protein [Anaerolineales bacterium]MCB0014431.1 phasin family protein [Anaerolineales bacterium]MCB0020538.1 phasin family protein [Anaerolineales bacterium]MCB8961624.1 phasin family protein [Ardenticatenales bacterium]